MKKTEEIKINKRRKIERKMKNYKGITLIALVVTIVVLLILAGVSIGMLTGENGIIRQAIQAKEQTESAKKQEEIKLEGLNDKINQIVNGVPEIRYRVVNNKKIQIYLEGSLMDFLTSKDIEEKQKEIWKFTLPLDNQPYEEYTEEKFNQLLLETFEAENVKEAIAKGKNRFNVESYEEVLERWLLYISDGPIYHMVYISENPNKLYGDISFEEKEKLVSEYLGISIEQLREMMNQQNDLGISYEGVITFYLWISEVKELKQEETTIIDSNGNEFTITPFGVYIHETCVDILLNSENEYELTIRNSEGKEKNVVIPVELEKGEFILKDAATNEELGVFEFLIGDTWENFIGENEITINGIKFVKNTTNTSQKDISNFDIFDIDNFKYNVCKENEIIEKLNYEIEDGAIYLLDTILY